MSSPALNPSHTPPAFSGFLHSAWHHRVQNTILVSWGQMSQVCSLSVFMHPQQTFWSGVVWATEKILALCKVHLSITENFLAYQYCFQLKSKAQPHTYQWLWRKLFLPQPKPEQINFQFSFPMHLKECFNYCVAMYLTMSNSMQTCAEEAVRLADW